MVADALSRDPFGKLVGLRLLSEPWFRKPIELKGILCRVFSMSVVDHRAAGEEPQHLPSQYAIQLRYGLFVRLTVTGSMQLNSRHSVWSNMFDSYRLVWTFCPCFLPRNLRCVRNRTRLSLRWCNLLSPRSDHQFVENMVLILKFLGCWDNGTD